jgi:hypothetical protein
MLKKAVVLLLVVVVVLAFSSVAFASKANSLSGFENSPVYVDSGWGSLTNVNNPELRHEINTGRTAIPGKAFENANLEKSVIFNHNGQSLVDPCQV